MSATAMIDFKDYELLVSNITTLHETSKDASDKDNIQYMTDSNVKVVDFDKVKECYHNLYAQDNQKDLISSADALAKTSESLVLIEFKNGNMQNSDQKRKVKEKLRDSLLLLSGIIDKSIAYSRVNVDFVLVYNEDKDKSRLSISKHILREANEELIRFDLERFKHVYLREIHTYTKAEFNRYLGELIDCIDK